MLQLVTLVLLRFGRLLVLGFVIPRCVFSHVLFRSSIRLLSAFYLFFEKTAILIHRAGLILHKGVLSFLIRELSRLEFAF